MVAVSDNYTCIIRKKTGFDILDSVLGMSFMYRRNNRGLRIEPW